MIRSIALAAAVLALAGCDRFEEAGGGLPPPVSGPAAPAAAVQTVYVKGSPEVSVGQTAEFRTEQVPGAASYRWTARGTGNVLFVASPADESGRGRVVGVGGSQRGPLVVEATALDAERRVIARGSREVTVR